MICSEIDSTGEETRMQAIVYTEFGPPEVLQLQEVAKPLPKEDEVQIRVHAAAVNYGDLAARNFKHIRAREFHMPLFLLLVSRLYFGLNKPKINILGGEFAGEVEAVGKDVTRFKPGDQVMGYLGQRMGAYAGYLCMPAAGTLALKPEIMSYAEAAAVPYGAIMAASLLRKANLQAGQAVLVNGASGGIGSAVVQLACYHGAQVTGVCGTPRVEYVRSLGADRVIDYTREDFTQTGDSYDLVFDVLGMSSFSKVKNCLKPGGTYFLSSFKTKALFQMLWTKIAGDKRVVCALASERSEDLEFVKQLVEAGRYHTIVDRCYSLEQAAEAHRYAESGGKKGSVVLVLD